MAVFKGIQSSNDIIISDTMSDGEGVASDVYPRYFFPPLTDLSRGTFFPPFEKKIVFRENQDLI